MRVSGSAPTVTPAVVGSYAAYASRPAAGTAGRVFVPSDGLTTFVDSGSAWRPIINGSVVGTQPPAAASFTLVQSTGLTNVATLTDQTGALKLAWSGEGDAGSSEPIRYAYKAAPADGAGGYRVTAHFRPVLPTNIAGTFNLLVGLGFRQGSDASIELMEVCFTPTAASLMRRRFTSSGTGIAPTFTFSALAQGDADFPFLKDFWLRVEHTVSGGRSFYISTDGLNFKKFTDATSAGNDFITPTQVFFSCSQYAANGGNLDLGGMVMDSYAEEAF